MKYILSESQIENLNETIQKLINSELEFIKKEAEEWGLGEMDEIHEIESVDRIEIDRLYTGKNIKVYVNIYRNSLRYDFQNVIFEIEDRLKNWIPNIRVVENEVFDIRKTGPGIDW